MGIAKHFETGESLPEDVYKKLVAARTFRAGSLSLRQVSTCISLLFLCVLSLESCGCYCTIKLYLILVLILTLLSSVT